MILNFRNCLYTSLMLHLLLCIVASVITNNSGIKKPFIVFGAHSKKNYHTLYKSGQLKKAPGSMVPFINHGKKSGTRTGHGTKAKRSHGQIHTKSGKNKAQSPSKARLTNKTLNAKTIASRSKTTKQNPKSKVAKKLASDNRPIIPEISGKKKKLLAAKLQQQKAQELAQKKELEEIIKERRQQKELAKLNKEIKKKIEKKEALEKVEALALKKAEEAKKFDSELKDEPETDKALIQNEDLKADEENTSEDDQALDMSDTSSTLVLNFSGKIDAETASYQKRIQQEVGRLWKPPLGVPRGTTCRIGFLVDRNGKIQNFEIKKRSSVLIYDLSILRIAHLFKFDKKLWGKNFTIDFCQ